MVEAWGTKESREAGVKMFAGGHRVVRTIKRGGGCVVARCVENAGHAGAQRAPIG